jgi:glutamine synthetase
MSFIDRHGLYTPDQVMLAQAVLERIKAAGLESVRIGFPDLHGIVRGKVLMASEVEAAFESGVSMTSSLFLKDSSHRTVMPVFGRNAGTGIAGFQGAADFLMVPDPATFQILPWAERTGWLLCDAYFPDGSPVPYATRSILRHALDRLAGRGMAFVAGLEVEFHLFKLDDPMLSLGDSGQPGTPPAVSLTHHGYNYLTEQRYDRLGPLLEILRQNIQALGLNLRSMEIEYGPSQVEFVFHPGVGMAPADGMILFRNAVKQVARRHGYHASFMCRPQIPNVCSSGWHLHQSLRSSADGVNLFSAAAGDAPLSALGMQYLAGLLRDAPACAAFSTPTINGYKRYRPHSLAPDRAIWGIDNRGVMLRVLGGPASQAARIENRIGEPAANPYLYLASQIAGGLAGIDDTLDPGPSADTPYEAAAPLLPRGLEQALAALDGSARMRAAFGDVFVDYLLHIKRAELARHHAEVSAWEQREYFDLF